jgi:PAS domain S-box-containing protein
VVAGITLIYAITVVPLTRAIGPEASAWVGLPLLVAAWFWGPAAGIAAAVAAVPLNLMLLTSAGLDGATIIQRGLLSYFLLAIGGAAVGWFGQLNRRVHEQREALERERDALAREVDVRKRFEAALQQRETIFRDLFNASPDAIFVEAMDGTILDVNPAACELQNLSREELIGRNVVELAPPAQQGSVQTDFSRLARGRNMYLHSKTYPKGGDPIPVEIKVSRIDYNDQPALLMHVRDVTERVRFANELEHQLRESLLLNRVIQTATSTLDVERVMTTMCEEVAMSMGIPAAGLALLNEGGSQLTVVAEYRDSGIASALGMRFSVEDNPSMETVIGRRSPFTSDDVQADDRLPEEVKAILAKQGTVALLLVPITVRDQMLGIFGLNALDKRTFSSDEIDLAMSVGSAVGQAIENIRLYEAIQTELAERQRTEIELMQAKEAAEAANRSKSVFLAQMSHELRTPLNSIIGYADLLKSGMYGTLSDKQVDRVAKVHRNGRHLLTIINDILDISKIEAGRMEFEIEPCRLEDVVDECLAAVKPTAAKKGLAVSHEVEEDMPSVLADRGRVLQILMNLMNNGVKFTQEGEVRVEARVVKREEIAGLTQAALESSGPMALIEVQDTGIGIDPVNQALIFDEFKQVDNSVSREYEGTGLGLAISYRLAQLMGGTIWVESTPGEGSTFSVLLPTTTAPPVKRESAIVRPPTSQDKKPPTAAGG